MNYIDSVRFRCSFVQPVQKEQEYDQTNKPNNDSHDVDKNLISHVDRFLHFLKFTDCDYQGMLMESVNKGISWSNVTMYV